MTVEFGTMSHRSSVLAMSLDSALESFTFGNSGCIHFISGSKNICFDFLSRCIFGCIVKFEFPYISLAGNSGFIEVALLSLLNTMSVNNFFLTALVFVDCSFFLVYISNLYGAVAIVVNGLDLGYYTGAGLKYGYRNQGTIFIENLSHSDFGS